jgi:hypothetical protein
MPTILRFFRPALKAGSCKNPESHRSCQAPLACARDRRGVCTHANYVAEKKLTAGYKTRYLAVTTLFLLRGT